MSAELDIRARRAAFNRAIADHDASAIGELLARDCVIVAGTDSSQIIGRHAQVKVWRAIFASGGETYQRLPESVVVSGVEPIAMEHGNWQGTGADGAVLNSGTYSAKWRDLGGQWVIEAEVYCTLA